MISLLDYIVRDRSTWLWQVNNSSAAEPRARLRLLRRWLLLWLEEPVHPGRCGEPQPGPDEAEDAGGRGDGGEEGGVPARHQAVGGSHLASQLTKLSFLISNEHFVPLSSSVKIWKRCAGKDEEWELGGGADGGVVQGDVQVISALLVIVGTRGTLYDKPRKKRVWRIHRIPYLTFLPSEIFTVPRIHRICRIYVFEFCHQNFEVTRIQRIWRIYVFEIFQNFKHFEVTRI